MDSKVNLSLLQKELLVSTDQSGQYWNICLWDYNSGTNLQTFKNCGTICHGLDFIRNDYMICAIYNKPYLNYFNLKGKTQQNKINTSACVNCLAVSSCGNYVALGIDDKVFILQSHAGKIVSVIDKHLQRVTVIKFAMNDHYLITGSDDTIINVWNFNELLTMDKEYLKPAHVWNSHSMPINDLYVSLIGDRVLSVSQDQTCKFWNLNNHESSSPAYTLSFQAQANRCILDNLESNLYVGLINGIIYCLPIKLIVSDSNHMLNDSMDLKKSFLGHNKKINCLSVSLDDSTLASGSDDGTIRVWDTLSRQCLKVINQNSPVTNVCFKLRTLFYNDEPNTISTLSNRYTTEASSTKQDATIVSVKTQRADRERIGLGAFLLDEPTANSSTTAQDSVAKSLGDDTTFDEYFELKFKYENLRQLNEKMYNFAIDKIINKR